MRHWIVDRHHKAEHLGGETADCGEQRVGSHYAFALRRHQRHRGIHQGLLGIEHIESGALADLRFIAHAVERHFRGGDLFLRRPDLRLGGLVLAPNLDDRGARLAVLPIMMKQMFGSIVNVGSQSIRGLYRVPYAASKGGILALSTVLAKEYGRYGIRVNTMAPGGTEVTDRVTAVHPARTRG